MNNKVSKKDFLVLKGPVGEIDVPVDNPFKYDELDREPEITALTHVIRLYQNGAVIALDGAWGTGKTTFVKLWKQELENNGFPVIYYNAWEDDVCEEPLFSMIKGLRSVSKDESRYDGFVEKAGRFIAGAVFGAVKSVAGVWGDTVSGAVKGGVEQLEKDCIDSLKSKDTTSTLLSEFKDTLRDYLSSCEKKCPLVYFVDELDRCNPTFAVKVLERIKHLFEVPNVVFVLSIDKKQLELSINGYFGSDKFDSKEYLRRFIDIEYPLRSSSIGYSSFLLEKYGILQYARNIGPNSEHYLKSMCRLLYYYNITLRQVEKVFLLVQLVLSNSHCEGKRDDTELFIPIYIFLAYLKVCNLKCFQNIMNKRYSLQELVDELESMMSLKEDPYNYEDLEQLSLNMLTILSCYHKCLNSDMELLHDEKENTFNKLRKLKYNKIDITQVSQNRELIVKNTFDIRIFGLRLELYNFGEN